MTRSWTTRAQRVFLDKKVTSFRESQERKDTATFFSNLFAEWREDNPDREPTSQEIANAKNRQEAVKKIENNTNKRLRAWFHNHTRGESSVGNSHGVLKIKTKSKAPQEWQIYGQMYGSKWKDIIEKEWKAYVADWESQNPGIEVPKKPFTFRNAFLQQKYAEESEEVKIQVRERRKQLKLDAAQNKEVENQNEEYQRAIDKLPRTLLTIGENICRQTGWYITFLVGGPSPKDGGKIMSYILNCGKTPAGKDYEAFLGDRAYDKHILDPFDTFLQKSFREFQLISVSLLIHLHDLSAQDIRDARRLDEDEPIDDDSSAGEEDGDPDSPNDSEADSQNYAAKLTGRSKYELVKERNIKRNKEVLRQLNAKFSVEESLAAVKLKKKEVAVSSSSNSTAVIVSKNVIDAPQDNASVSRAVNGHDDISKLSSQLRSGTLSSLSNAAHPNTLEEAAGALSPDPAPATPLLPDSSISREANSISGHGDNINEPSDTNARPDGASQPPLEASQGPRLASVDDISKLPSWLTNPGMVSYLRGVSRESLWQELVTTFLRFESLNPNSGKLPTASRPNEVQAWIRNKKKDAPPAVDPQAYGAAFTKWWETLQPSWRTRNDGPLSYELPPDEDWCVLGKGGSAGIYTVIVALSWWIIAGSAESDSTSPLWAAVYDVHWVIDQIICMTICTTKGKKRASDDAVDEASMVISSKRYYLFFVVVTY
ncbi:hypothetical protein F5887DRAFT_892945 [Amanita rubescens]|nr:hypothetical protein F5887DRAFT_892945 [Amanita rubescens]